MTTATTVLASLLGLVCLLIQNPQGREATQKNQPKTHTVEIAAMKFKPAQLQVNKGDKVVFINRDMVAHNATEISGKQWRSENLQKDQSWSFTVAKSAEYYCTLHPVMKGQIIVKP